MNKQKPLQSLKTLKLQEYLNQYDSTTLVGILNSFELTPAWAVFTSFLKLRQREFEIAALDLINKEHQVQAAAYASGYAKGVEDVADTLIQQLKDFVVGKTAIVENNRPEEAEVG